MKEKVIAIFDIGKTNKKIILFNYDLKPVWEFEEKFTEIKDDDGFECDDIEKIENWVFESLNKLVKSREYDLTSVNFATYGATLAYLDSNGQRLGPIYNYLKPIDEIIPERIYRRHGGQDEFCRRTASPALGMLNSGLQAVWLKYSKPDIFNRVGIILHFPQYMSYLLTRKIYSEHTSIGCHTALWDFDNMRYHDWTREEGLPLPEAADISTVNDVIIGGKTVKAGIGIHDSSSSLVPYFIGSNGKFLLMSTGTWCINMNPFHAGILTAEQLDHDCLCYMSVAKQPVKSSRLFLGHLHEVAVGMLSEHFKKSPHYYKNVKPDSKLIELCRTKCREKRFFFENMPYSRNLKDKYDFFAFKTFEEGYHQLMTELSELTVESVNLVLPADDDIENIYITGGFSPNQLFIKLISDAYPAKNVYTSEIFNATALGAALVVLNSLEPDKKPALNLGLNRC